MNNDRILAGIETFYLILQIIGRRFPCHCIRELLQVLLLFFEQRSHGTVCCILFLDVLTRCFVDGDDALGVAIYETDCQNHDNGNNAIAEGYLEWNIVFVHVKSTYLIIFCKDNAKN